MMEPAPAIHQLAPRHQGLLLDEKRAPGLRFALDGTKNHTLDKMAAVLDTGPAEVRRMEQSARAKQRVPLGCAVMAEAHSAPG